MGSRQSPELGKGKRPSNRRLKHRFFKKFEFQFSFRLQREFCDHIKSELKATVYLLQSF